MISQQSTKSILCSSVSNLSPKQMLEMYHEAPEYSVEYVIGENDEEETVPKNDSDEKTAGSCETSDSSDLEEIASLPPIELLIKPPINPPNQQPIKPPINPPNQQPIKPPITNGVTCNKCGRGPFRSVKRHLLYCHGVKEKFQCVLCKHYFFSEETLLEHHTPLYLCHSCGQVLPTKNSFSRHPCPREVKSTLVLFCSQSMPKACKLCKSYFSSEKALSIHVTKVHLSESYAKHCIVAGSSLLTEGTSVQNQAASRNLYVGQAHVDPNSPTADTRDSELDASSALSILALFENESQRWALMKRMNTGWRSKTPCPCRQCGAVLRQPSFAIIHRYLHRGQRLHLCQCGRAFRHQLHLLRHCVQHAEALSYICVGCGDTFSGAKHLTQHLTGKTWQRSRHGWTVKESENKKCCMPFMCDCGLVFLRPSAYIWHQLKNRTKRKSL